MPNIFLNKRPLFLSESEILVFVMPYTIFFIQFFLDFPEKIMISPPKKLKLIQFGVQNINKKCKKLIWAPFLLYNKSKI